MKTMFKKYTSVFSLCWIFETILHSNNKRKFDAMCRSILVFGIDFVETAHVTSLH